MQVEKILKAELKKMYLLVNDRAVAFDALDTTEVDMSEGYHKVGF